MKSIAAFQGIPTSSGQFAPMMLLVPHLRAQGFNKSVSFIQIVNILNKIQVVSYFQKKEIVTEFAKAYNQDNIKLNRSLMGNGIQGQCQEEHDHDDEDHECQNDRQPEPQKKGGFQFTITTIQPTNIYKRILAQCCDKDLDRNNCNLLNSFYTIDKHHLFDSKTMLSIRLQIDQLH